MQTALQKNCQKHQAEPSDLTPVAGLLVERIGDEVLVLNPSSGRIHQFNHTAGIVWRGIDDGLTREIIAANIAERYDVPIFRALKDTNTMIEQLKVLKLLDSPGEAPQAEPVMEYRQNNQ